MPGQSTVLFRPVGPQELELIRQSDWTRFPPRLPEQPIFYPVLNVEYATQIARDWNVKASGAGFVTKFEVSSRFLEEFPVRVVGGSQHAEYWIPAERLDEFNRNIIGKIDVVLQFQEPTAHSAWVKVYELAADLEAVMLIQQASLGAAGFGFEPEIALFGSKEWWAAVEDGRIPTHSIDGVISRVYMTGHNDWPQFDIQAGDQKTSWTREGNQNAYRVGRRVRLEYVVQRHKRNSMSGADVAWKVTRILMEPSQVD